jgi:hypothetical protein
MTWNTDWASGVSETITEIESLAANQATDEANIAALQAAVNPIVTSGSGSIAATSSVIENQFLKLYAIGTTNGGTSISLVVNGNSVFTFTTAFSGGSNQDFLLEMTLFWDGSLLWMAPVSPLNTNDLHPAYASIGGSPSTLTFSIGGSSWVGVLDLKFA